MAAEKVDMSLEDIIALNSNKRRGGGRGGLSRGRGGRGRGLGRGRGVGRGRGRGQSQSVTPTRGAGGLRQGRGARGRGIWNAGRGSRGNVVNFRNNQRETSQQSRQSARSASFDAHRNLQTTQRVGKARGGGINRRKLVRPAGLQSGRGGVRGARARGRGRGVVRGEMSGVKARLGIGPRGRGLLVRGSRGVARGRGRIQTAAAASVARAKRTLQQNQQTTDVFKTRRGRGRRGRGIGRQTEELPDNNRIHVSFTSPTTVNPEGIDLAFNFGATHHTQQSLNNRFTPPGAKKRLASNNRVILPNGRSVEYNL